MATAFQSDAFQNNAFQTGSVTPSAVGFIVSMRPPESYKRTIKYKTDIISSANGTERRRALRLYPRESFEISYFVSDDEALALRAVLYAAPAAPVLVAEEDEAVISTTAVSGTSVSIDTTKSDAFAVGVSVLVRNQGDDAYGAVISAMSPGTPGVNVLTLDAVPPVGLSFPIGSAIVPLRAIQMADGMPLARYALGEGVLSISGDATAIRTTIGTSATVTTFDGFPVVTPPAERDDSAPVEEHTSAELTVLDFGGSFEVRTQRTAGMIQRMHQWTIDGVDDRQWWKKFIATVIGKQVKCLLPTWRSDFFMSSQPAPGATSLLITSESDFAGTWRPKGFIYLQLHHADGTVEYAKTTAAVDNGNGTQTVTVSAGVTGTAIDYVSLLETCRLDSDEVAFAWQPGLVCPIAIPFAMTMSA